MPILNPKDPSPYRFSDYEPEAEAPTASAGPAVRWELIVGAFAVVAVLGWLGFRSFNGPHTESIARIRNHAASFDGRTIAIRGTVGDIYDLGSSTTYQLYQGGESIVVFTRGAAPRLGSTVTVHGSVSVGYLDGAPRPALFETAGASR